MLSANIDYKNQQPNLRITGTRSDLTLDIKFEAVHNTTVVRRSMSPKVRRAIVPRPAEARNPLGLKLELSDGAESLS